MGRTKKTLLIHVVFHNFSQCIATVLLSSMIMLDHNTQPLASEERYQKEMGPNPSHVGKFRDPTRTLDHGWWFINEKPAQKWPMPSLGSVASVVIISIILIVIIIITTIVISIPLPRNVQYPQTKPRHSVRSMHELCGHKVWTLSSLFSLTSLMMISNPIPIFRIIWCNDNLSYGCQG